MTEEKFKDAALWVGGIVAAILIEAIVVRIAQRCAPGIFGQPTPVQPPQR
jgi:hypothetical protein